MQPSRIPNPSCPTPGAGLPPAFLRKAEAELERAKRVVELSKSLPRIIRELDNMVQDQIRCGAPDDCVKLTFDARKAKELVGTTCDDDIALGLMHQAAEGFAETARALGYQVEVKAECLTRKKKVPCGPCSDKFKIKTEDYSAVTVKVCFGEAETPRLPRMPKCDRRNDCE